MAPKHRRASGQSAPKARAKAKALRELVTLMDHADHHEQESTTQTRRVRRRSSDEAANKKIRDNFGGWTEEQTHVHLVSGKSLFQTIKDYSKKSGDDVKLRLCYFITCEEPESNTQTRTTIIGVKALKKHFAINRHKMDTKAEMNLQDIKALNMYKFLLSDAEEKVVTAMTSYVATSSTGAQVSVGGDEPTKKPGPKKTVESANKFAQGFFT